MVSKESECNTTLIWLIDGFAQYVNVLTHCSDDLIMEYINEKKVVKKLCSILKFIKFEHALQCKTFINNIMH